MSKSLEIPAVKLEWLQISKILTLKRNPQYLTPKQMESLKASVQRDGFVCPILVRPLKSGKFEVISGNHRFMAAKEIGMDKVPCVVSNMPEKAMKRLAVNLNTIHGNPNAELLAPFLADLDQDTLAEIHIDPADLEELCEFDEKLKQSLDKLQIPESIDHKSPHHKNDTCKCAKCGKVHVKTKM